MDVMQETATEQGQPVEAARVLNAQDRCDTGSCGAQAYYLVLFDQGELLFCGHHFNKNENLLREKAYHIVDQYGDVD